MISGRTALPVSRRFLLASGGHVLIASCVISGCSSLLPTPKTLPIYVLEPPVPTVPAGYRVNWQLAVALPRAQASLDTIRIALRKPSPILDYYADAACPIACPFCFRTSLSAHLSAAAGILGVGRDDSGIAANYRLETELLNFEAHYDQANTAPQVQVQFEASLVSLPARTIVARTTVIESASATKNDLSDIVISFDHAAAMTLGRIVDWTFKQLPG